MFQFIILSIVSTVISNIVMVDFNNLVEAGRMQISVTELDVIGIWL